MQQFIDVAGDSVNVKVCVHLAEMRSANVAIQILWASNLSLIHTWTAPHVIKKKIASIVWESIADRDGPRQRVDDIGPVHYGRVSNTYITAPKAANAASFLVEVLQLRIARFDPSPQKARRIKNPLMYAS